jgi:hypothetical protein
MALKPCPNPNCDGTYHPSYGKTEVHNKPFVYCCTCGMRGPAATTKERCGELWNDLPRSITKSEERMPAKITPVYSLELGEQSVVLMRSSAGEYILATDAPIRVMRLRHVAPHNFMSKGGPMDHLNFPEEKEEGFQVIMPVKTRLALYIDD